MISISTLCLWSRFELQMFEPPTTAVWSGILQNIVSSARASYFPNCFLKFYSTTSKRTTEEAATEKQKKKKKSTNENSTQESKLLFISPFIQSPTRSSHHDVGRVFGGGCSGIHGRRSGFSRAAVVGLVPATTNNQQSTCSSFIFCYYK